MTAVYLIFLLSLSWQHCHFRCPRTKQVKPKTIRAGIFLFRAIWNYLITWKIPLIHARAGDPFYPSSEEYTTPFLSLFFSLSPPAPPSVTDGFVLTHTHSLLHHPLCHPVPKSTYVYSLNKYLTDYLSLGSAETIWANLGLEYEA